MLLSKTIIQALTTVVILQATVLAVEPKWDSVPKEKPPLPGGKLIRPFQEKESWTINISRQSSANGQTAPASQTSGALQDEPRREQSTQETARLDLMDPLLMVETSTGGKKGVLRSYEYSTFGLYYEESPERGEPVLTNSPRPDATAGSPPFHHLLYWATKGKKFIDFDWISAANYIGVEEVNGIPCMVFSNETTKAWVGLAKREPVLWMAKRQSADSGGQSFEVRKFTNNGTPSSIAFPDEVKAHMVAYAQQVKALTSPPRRGPRP